MGQSPQYITNLEKAYGADEDLVGKKAHELGLLWKIGIPLPDGFVITTEFFKEFLILAGINEELKKTKTIMHPALSDSIDKLTHPVQIKILRQHIPQSLSIQLHKSYRNLSGLFKSQPLSVFSSSFANKSIFFSNIKGDSNLILKIKTIWSMFLTDPVAIIVQKDIDSKIKGKINTDAPISDKRLTKSQANNLTEYCKLIQKYLYFPKEIEYSIKKGKIFITKLNPFAGVTNQLPKPTMQIIKSKKNLIKGISVNPGIVTGPVKIFRNKKVFFEVKKGDIIVLSDFSPSIYKKIRSARAIVVDSMLTNSLSKALFRKDFKIPTVEGVKNATKIFQDGNVVTVNGITGEIHSGGYIC